MVRDGETGTPLPGAVVQLAPLGRFTVTDSLGEYLFAEVPAGPQHLSITQLGYASRNLQALVPSSGQLRINITLRPEPIPVAGIDVTGLTLLRGLEEGDRAEFADRRMTMAAVRNNPLLAEPDVFQALGGGEVFLSPESPTGMHIRGGASDQTSYLLDDIPVFNPYHVAGLFSAWNPDALSGLELLSSSPSPALPEALSGTVAATTRPPSPEFRAQGGVSTSNIRLTADGPLGGMANGYVLSFRSGFPGGIAKDTESSYLRGESLDWLGKIEISALGGRLHITGYGNRNEIEASAVGQRTGSGPNDPAPDRNAFGWDAQAIGATWERAGRKGTVRVRGWYTSTDAGSRWNGHDGLPTRLNASREDLGFAIEGEGEFLGGRTLSGLRFEESHTPYRTTIGEDRALAVSIGARTRVASPFFKYSRDFGRGFRTEIGAGFPTLSGGVRMAPRAFLGWAPNEFLSLSGGYARLFQFAQSLRNSESVVGNIFPADLFLGAGADGVPVSSAHQGTLSLDLRPVPGTHLAARGYVKTSDDLLLVAPLESEPFSTGEFSVGSGTTSGVSLEGGLTGPRAGVLFSYGWQKVRLKHSNESYVPAWGAAHSLETGAIFFPTSTSSVRVGITGMMGRKTTAVDGVLEWESCNLLDRGCEFGGSPGLGDNPRGGTHLPAYFRLDLGAQKHWHIRIAGRDALWSLFGSLTNLFGRKNLLTFATDPATGERIAVEMRPLAPLVVGLNWRF